MLGLLVALLATFLTQVTGNLYLDGIASIVIGLILGGTAIWLAVETKSLLIGERANVEVIEGIRGLAAGIPLVDSVNEVLTMHMGPEFILVNLSVKFSDSASATDIEQSVVLLDASIKKQFLNVRRVFVEAEALQSRPLGD
jgi:divalent metal cation (Fe/Co/Zn/Cd) transporter